MRSVFYRKSLVWILAQALVFNQCAFALEQTRNIEAQSACLAPALTIQAEIINALKDPMAVKQSLETVTARGSIQSVVFGGTLEQWENYVNKTWKQRYSSQGYLKIVVDREKEEIIINPLGNDIYSSDLAKALNQGIKLFQNKLKNIAYAQELFRSEVIQNMANKAMAINLRLSDILPTEASREIFLDDNLDIQHINIVLKRSMVERVLKEYNSRDVSDQDKELGILWPLIKTVVHELGNKNLPRDRFIEAIDRSYYMAIWERNILFKEKKSPNKLVPNKIGKCYLDYIAQEYGIDQEMVMDVAYFRMLSEIATFITDQRLQKDREMKKRLGGDPTVNLAKIYIREYLDGKYLRPSLASIIPETSEPYKPMNLAWKNQKPITPHPEVGKYGIEDKEDLHAWKKVSQSFAQKGLILLAQLGIGGFGRVYLARNIAYNKAWPRDIAVKVDRIYRVVQKSSIKTQENIMALSRDLSNSPHVIRIRDAGVLDEKYTYHILQLVDGLTLDDLMGIAGRDSPGSAKLPTPKNFMEKMAELFMPARDWSDRAKQRKNTIKQYLTLRQTLDILISILLKVEEIHKLGYSISDIKTGNIMISRNGWLKGIDLDDFKKIPDDPRFLMQDFFLLATTILFIYSYATGNKIITKKEFIVMSQDLPDNLRQKMLQELDNDKREYITAENIFKLLNYYNPGGQPIDEVGVLELKLRKIFKAGWKFSDLPADKADAFINIFTRLIFNSRCNEYGYDSAEFSEDIDKLIYLKRLFFEREMILTLPDTVSDDEIQQMSKQLKPEIESMDNLSPMAEFISLGNIMLVEQAI